MDSLRFVVSFSEVFMIAQKKINYLLRNCSRFNSHSWVAYLYGERERERQAEGKEHRQTLSRSHSRTESWRVDDHDGEVEGKWSVGLVTKIFICSALQDIGKLVFSYTIASDGQKVDLLLTLDLKFKFLTSSSFCTPLQRLQDWSVMWFQLSHNIKNEHCTGQGVSEFSNGFWAQHW